MNGHYSQTPEPRTIRIRKTDGRLLTVSQGMEIYTLEEPIVATKEMILMLPLAAQEGGEIGVYDAETQELIKVVKIGPRMPATS